MYLSHYDLKEKPFQINPDPKFLWLGATHKEALAILKYGILDSRGFLLLVGDVGTGKTTLINGLLDSLDQDTIVATVPDPGLDKLDFYNFLAHAFKMDSKFTSKGDFLVQFMHFLHKAHTDKKKVLLVVDEAQRLDDEMLEEIRLLSNIEKKDARLLNIFLVGQDELNEILAGTKSWALLQRITRYSIGPLKKSEIGDYVKFRLSIAGTEKKIFNSGAIREITSFSKCYPRMINIICDHALLTGYVKGLKKIDAKVVKECAIELSPPKDSWKKKRQKLKSIRQKSTWLIPVGIGLFAILLFAGGYLYFGDRYGKAPAPIKAFKPDASSAMVPSNKATGYEKKLPTDSKFEKKSVSVNLAEEKKNVSMPFKENATDADLIQKEDSGTAEPKEPVTEEAVKTMPYIQDVDQKASGFDSKKQAIKEPVKAPAVFPDQKLTINFPLDSNEFTDEAYELLDRFVALIFQNPDAAVSVKGYTDSTGNYSYNKRLSRFRANMVKSYLVGQGVSPKKIKTFGMGPENPIEPNSTPQGRSANRRIEIQLHKSKP
jgi:general secretion pathway protein A